MTGKRRTWFDRTGVKAPSDLKRAETRSKAERSRKQRRVDAYDAIIHLLVDFRCHPNACGVEWDRWFPRILAAAKEYLDAEAAEAAEIRVMPDGKPAT